MKKLLLILLAMLLAFSLIACDGEDETTNTTASSQKNEEKNDFVCQVHYDIDGNGKCDSCDTATTNDTTVAGSALTQALKAQLDSVATAKLEFSTYMENKGESWISETEQEKYLSAQLVEYSVTVAKTENGFNLKVESKTKATIDYNGTKQEFALDNPVIYVIDGVVYEYNEENDVYYATKLDMSALAEIEGVLAMILANVEIDEAELESALNQLGAAFIESFNIVENKGSVKVDLAEAYNEILNYIKSINLEEMTLAALINDGLKLIDETLTVEGLLQGMVAVANMTIEEYIGAIDESMQATYGVALQDVYDSIINNETVQMLIRQYLEAQGDFEENITAKLDSLKKAKILDLIPYEMRGLTLYELGLMLGQMDESEGESGEDIGVGTEPQDEFYEEEEKPSTLPETPEELIATINAFLNMSLADIDAAFELGLAETLEGFGYMSIEKLEAELSVGFKGLFLLDTIEGKAEFSMVTEAPSDEVDGKTDKGTTSFKVTFKVYGLSSTATEIAVPTDKEIVVDISGEYAVEGSYAEMFEYVEIDFYGDYADVTFYTYYGDEVYSEFSPAVDEDYTFVVLEEVYYYNSGEVEYYTPLVLSFDFDSFTCTVEGAKIE